MAKVKQYNDDFKQMIVGLYNSKKTTCEITREYGLSNSALYKWIKECSTIKAFRNYH